MAAWLPELTFVFFESSEKLPIFSYRDNAYNTYFCVHCTMQRFYIFIEWARSAVTE